MKPEFVFLLEHAPWPAFLVESSGLIRHANPAAIRWFGDRLKPGSGSLAAIWSEENGTTAQQFLEECQEAAPAASALKWLNPLNHAVTLPASVCRAGDASGNGFLVQLMPDSLCPDTRGHNTETNLAQKQKLDCALQLTRTVALDFNNALTSILGHASLVLSKLEPQHPLRASLVEVEKAAEKAAEIAQQLAAFSRSEKEPGSQAAGNLNALLHRLVDMFQRRPNLSTVWSVQLEQTLFSAKFDEAKVQQAFAKILENAVEATSNAGRVQVATRNLEITEATQDRTARLAPGSYVCVEIADDGAGIEAEAMPRIFEPFFSTKRGHRGLGLAWVYGIITNHGGSVAVSSQPNRGTSVRVYLPAMKRFVSDSEPQGDDLTGRGTVLIVDDEELMLTMGYTVLSAYGYRVLTADSGPKALEMMVMSKAREPVDLVITDLVMPQMSGRELIQQIRQLAPEVPIICTSGYVRSGSVEAEGLYLQKPFTSQELLRRVKQVLSGGE